MRLLLSLSWDWAESPSRKAEWDFATPACLLYSPTREPTADIPSLCSSDKLPQKLDQLGVTRMVQGGSASVQEALVQEQPRVRLQVRASQNEDVSGWQ